MGGNTKFKGARTRTATYNETDGTRKAVRDTNGNTIQVGVGRQVGRGQRTNTTAANARERMQNAASLQEIRDLAKTVRTFNSKYNKPGAINSNTIKQMQSDGAKLNSALIKLGTLANQIQPGTVQDGSIQNPLLLMSNTEKQNIEKVLGVKLM